MPPDRVAMTNAAPSPRVLVFIDHYLPGYRAGGPLRTIAAMVKQLSDEFTFLVVTSDRDLGDQTPYPHITTGSWTTVEGTATYYLGPRDRSNHALRTLLASTPHDVLYLNSLFSFDFSIKILLLRRFGLLQTGTAVLAPRGELGAGAMLRSPKKKRAFIRTARTLRLHRGVMWQASSAQEAGEIEQQIAGAVAYVAPDLADTAVLDYGKRLPKKKGAVQLLFLSRISPKKNLHGAINILRGTSRQVVLSVCGPIEDADYWKACQTLAGTLPDNVQYEYLGEVPHPQITPLLRNHDVLFLPTLHENFGHVILESLSTGTPVLISDQTPWRQLRQQFSGWDLPLGRPRLFIEAIDQLAEMDERAFMRWSRGARSAAERWFASDDAVRRNRALLRAASTTSH
jgi:glycosyltransferase involved in cell wall biosynthesis